MIYDQLDLISQINFRLVSKRFSNFHLTNFWNLEKTITNQILIRNPFIKRLDLSNSSCVSTVENLIYLERLNISNSNVASLANLPNLRVIFLDSHTDIPLLDNAKHVFINKNTTNLLDDNVFDENLFKRYLAPSIGMFKRGKGKSFITGQIVNDYRNHKPIAIGIIPSLTDNGLAKYFFGNNE